MFNVTFNSSKHCVHRVEVEKEVSMFGLVVMAEVKMIIATVTDIARAFTPSPWEASHNEALYLGTVKNALQSLR